MWVCLNGKVLELKGIYFLENMIGSKNKKYKTQIRKRSVHVCHSLIDNWKLGAMSKCIAILR
jgi:hypothetical protein